VLLGERARLGTVRFVDSYRARLLLAEPAGPEIVPGLDLILECTSPTGCEPIRLGARVDWIRTAGGDYGSVAVGLHYRALPGGADLAPVLLELERPPVVLLVGGLPAESLEALRSAFALRVTSGTADAVEALQHEDIAVVVVGPELPTSRACDLLAAFAELCPDSPARVIVLAAGQDMSLFQPFVDDDTLFYLSRACPRPEDLLALVTSATNGRRAMLVPPPWRARSEPQVAHVHRILDLGHTLAVQTDRASAAELARRSVAALSQATRAYCLLHEEAEDVLSSRDPRAGVERSESAATGLAGFVTRTGIPLRIAWASHDPRYDPDADDPGGKGDEHLMIVPVRGHFFPSTLAVLIAVRSGDAREFEPSDETLLQLLARELGGVLGRLSVQAEIEDGVGHDGAVVRGTSAILYREEAVKSHVAGGRHGDVLRLWHGWAVWGYRLVVAGGIVAFLGLTFTSVDEYATGLAVVRLPARFDVKATAGAQGNLGEVVALMPGRYQSRLRPGLSLRLELAGFPDVLPHLIVASVRREVVGGEDARRYVGNPTVVASLPPAPVSVLTARLPGPTFVAEGETHEFADGMLGTAKVRVGSQRLLFLVFPALRSLLDV
jgi:GAF domain-containing protein